MANITLVITGGVRASKQWDLTTRLQQDGHVVRCLPTWSALPFLLIYYLKKPWRILDFLKVWHAPFMALLGYLFHKAGSVSHINSAKWSDVLIVAPATCNSLSKIVSGITDNFAILTIRAAARNKIVIVAPSMNPEMWFDPFIQKNIDRLNQTRKYVVVAPRIGEMRSGDIGASAMASDKVIVSEAYRALKLKSATPTLTNISIGHTAAQVTEDAPSERTATLLIVDHNNDFVSQLLSVGNKEFKQLQLISIGKTDDAIELALTRKPSVMIIDIDSPGKLTGGDLINTIGQHPDLMKIPVIAISNKEREYSNWESLANQGIQYIPKPLIIRFLLQSAIGHISISRDH